MPQYSLGRSTLLQHQRNALDWASTRLRVALFMEMRLGKTRVAIHWAEQHKGPKLVVCPLSVLPVWESELAICGLEGVSARGFRGIFPQERGLGWFLINYELLRRNPELLSMGWQCIILDESPVIKNPRAKITKILSSDRVMHIPCRAILTGLPAPEGPQDYFTQFRFLLDRFMGCDTFWKWKYRHTRTREYSNFEMYQSSFDELREEVKANSYRLTRKQAGIGGKKIYSKRFVDLPPKLEKVYRIAKREYTFDDQEYNLTMVVRHLLHRMAGGALAPVQSYHKVQEIYALLRGELREQQVVIWCAFLSEIKMLKESLARLGTTVAVIRGATPKGLRELRRKQFQRGRLQILICQTRCARYGLDMSSASAAIYFSNLWGWDDRRQSEDRVIHPLKKEPSLIIDIVARGTIDEDIIKALQTKKVTSGSVFRDIARKVKEEHERFASSS